MFLGTGSGGSIQRCHTCIYVELESSTILLDASSGNSALVNGHKLDLDLNSIDHLLLSHSHHDHSRGLEYLESYRNASGASEPLQIYGSKITLRDVKNFFKAMDKDFIIDETGVSRPPNRRTLKWMELVTGNPVTIDGLVVKSHSANHIDGAVGWRLEGENEVIVFSGDTQFTENTITNANKADVLIHEAYGLKQDSERLKIVKHSSAYDAGLIAAKADVGRLIITHISTEYHGKESLLLEEAREVYSGPISVAHDLMDVRI